MNRKAFLVPFVVPALITGLTSCTATDDSASEPETAAPSTPPAETEPAERLTVVSQPGGGMKAITFDPESLPALQAVFEGALSVDDEGCIALETGEGISPLAFSSFSFKGFGATGEILLAEDGFALGDTVSITGGGISVGSEELAECGNPSGVTQATSVTRR
ncbi:hypothetical protein [Leucobacter sp. wl10]|uniref:hypothetical protein n=1 Tax=Leucobacter sp. wl10 TaxID=2304677 RepID=UPI0013C2D2BD|nr:hypothetical protein [Leucobacter sp. wl10]